MAPGWDRHFAIWRRCAAATSLGLALVLAYPATAVWAADALDEDTQQDARGGPAWSDLSAGQRTALAPLSGAWATVGAQRKRKWIEIADRFPSMSASEKQRVQERMGDWARLSPQERGRARSNFQQAQQLSPEERQARWREYQALPEEKRRALADRNASVPRGRDARERATDPQQRKSNIVGDSGASNGNPGATTRPPLQPASPPRHQQTGLPKINATPDFVDKATLLPQRGPQGAAIRQAPRASEPRQR